MLFQKSNQKIMAPYLDSANYLFIIFCVATNAVIVYLACTNLSVCLFPVLAVCFLCCILCVLSTGRYVSWFACCFTYYLVREVVMFSCTPLCLLNLQGFKLKPVTSHLNVGRCHTFHSSFEEDLAASACYDAVVTTWCLISTNQAHFGRRGRLSQWRAERTHIRVLQTRHKLTRNTQKSTIKPGLTVPFPSALQHDAHCETFLGFYNPLTVAAQCG